MNSDIEPIYEYILTIMSLYCRSSNCRNFGIIMFMFMWDANPWWRNTDNWCGVLSLRFPQRQHDERWDMVTSAKQSVDSWWIFMRPKHGVCWSGRGPPQSSEALPATEARSLQRQYGTVGLRGVWSRECESCERAVSSTWRACQAWQWMTIKRERSTESRC